MSLLLLILTFDLLCRRQVFPFVTNGLGNSVMSNFFIASFSNIIERLLFLFTSVFCECPACIASTFAPSFGAESHLLLFSLLNLGLARKGASPSFFSCGHDKVFARNSRLRFRCFVSLDIIFDCSLRPIRAYSICFSAWLPLFLFPPPSFVSPRRATYRSL